MVEGGVAMRWIASASMVLGLLLVVGCASPGAPTTPTSGPSPALATPSPTVPSISPTASPMPSPTVPSISLTASPMPSPTSAPPPAVPTAAPPTPTRAPAPTGTPVVQRPPSQATPGVGPLFLEVVEPAGETVEVPAGTGRVTIVGKTRPGAVVSVNGELALPDESGIFRADVTLGDEMTLVEVVASDASGAELRAERVIVRE